MRLEGSVVIRCFIDANFLTSQCPLTVSFYMLLNWKRGEKNGKINAIVRKAGERDA